MNSKEFKYLLYLQIFTLVLVLILVVNSLQTRVAESVTASRPMSSASSMVPENTVKINGQDSYLFGQKEAPNFLLVFSNYNCSHCRYFYTHVMDSLDRDFIKNGRLKVVSKSMVRPEDKMGYLLARLVEVGRQTGKFLQVHHAFTSREEDVVDSLKAVQIAYEAGLTEEEVRLRLNAPFTLQQVNGDYKAAEALNIKGTPSFVLNGKVHPGYMTYGDIAKELSQK
jgi:protein-disulfide isomerase